MSDDAAYERARKRLTRARSMASMARKELTEATAAFDLLNKQLEDEFAAARADLEAKQRSYEDTKLRERTVNVLKWFNKRLNRQFYAGSIEDGRLLLSVQTRNRDEVQLEVGLDGYPPWNVASWAQLVERIPEQAIVDLIERIDHVESLPTITPDDPVARLTNGAAGAA